MSYLKMKDGVDLYYKDWGSGQPVVFSHGWPLSSDAWDGQMLFFGAKGYRVIAHDRRGHGRSQQTWNGNTMDTYADDLAQLMESLDLHDAVLIGHSTGGGEVARYLGRHGSARVAKAVLLAAVPPLLVKGPQSPDGVPIEVLDGIRQGLEKNRAQFYIDFALPFFGYDRPNATTSEGLQRSFWMQGMMGGIKSQWDCIKEFSETDFHEDLAKIDVPTLVMHSEDDAIVPYAAAGALSAKLIKGAKLNTYQGLPHAMPLTHADLINQDLLAFLAS